MAAKKNQEEGAPAWVVTYGDCMSLLLTFFVMLSSIAYFDEAAYFAAAGSLKKALGAMPGRAQVLEHEPPAAAQPQPSDAQAALLEQIVKGILQEIQFGGIAVERTPKGIRVRVPTALLFEPGSAEVKEAAVPLLKELADVVAYKGFDVRVEGHTDSTPVVGGRYSSNWELSAARAASVVEVMVRRQGVDASRFEAVGRGAEHPVASNDTAAGRELNRRVDIFIDVAAVSEAPWPTRERVPLLRAISGG